MEKTIKELSPMIHKLLYRYFPTYSHDDLYQECIVITLEQIEKFDQKKGAKLSSWIYEQLKGRIPKYIKKNMLTIAVPHNIKPEWSFGNIDIMSELSYEDLSEKETLSERIKREEEEEKILKKARKEVQKSGKTKKINKDSKEYVNVLDRVLEGYSLVEISLMYNKKKDWAKSKVKTIENRLSNFNSMITP